MDIIKIVESLEEYGIWFIDERCCEIKMKQKNKEVDFLACY